jgi:hypothetical protein
LSDAIARPRPQSKMALSHRPFATLCLPAPKANEAAQPLSAAPPSRPPVRAPRVYEGDRMGWFHEDDPIHD